VGSAWGNRQDLYQRFRFGPYHVRKQVAYDTCPLGDSIKMVERLLASPATDEAPFPLALGSARGLS
jgi:hypothetical protein